jgi:RNA polymerase sigma-70 factor (ECF subfamily)
MARKKILNVRGLSDEGVIALIVKKGGLEYYLEIVRRYQRKLFSYIFRLVRSREETEDILQNVFVKTYRNLSRFDQKKKFSSWIYRIAHNEAVNYLKRRSRKQFVSWEDLSSGEIKAEARSEEKSPLQEWAVKESREELKRAIKKIPRQYREVLELRYFSEKSYKEISRLLKRPVNTVGTLINRAKMKLAEVVRKQ